MSAEPIFFESPDAFGAWLDEHGERERELWVGLWKLRPGRDVPLRWEQAVEEALCRGWIDSRRIAALIADSAAGQTVKPFSYGRAAR